MTSPAIEFDLSKASLYNAKVTKLAFLVDCPADFPTTTPVSWNNDGNYESQPMVGPFYVIYELDGKPCFYTVRKDEFEGTHETVDGIKNCYRKVPTAAYQYDGPDSFVNTIKADGTIERKNAPITAGDWFVMWAEGAIGVRPNEGETSFPTLNDVTHPMPLPDNWPNS